jgi:hypothetical protein
MNRKSLIANAFLWAAAIIASATAGAPHVLSVLVLPALAAVSVVVIGSRGCAHHRPD